MPHWCNGIAQDSSKVLVKVRVLNGVLNVGLDEVVKSPHFQCGDYGFKSHTQYNMVSSTNG